MVNINCEKIVVNIRFGAYVMTYRMISKANEWRRVRIGNARKRPNVL
jgi:hypothetical protein